MNLKRIVAGAAMAGALGFTALGMGAGIANAAPPAPTVSGIAWQQDHDGHWGHGGDGDWGRGGGWDNRGGDWDNRGNWGPGPGWAPCVTGPFGFVTFCP
jgi:hypothetical protein